jgi:hypothetical protein
LSPNPSDPEEDGEELFDLFIETIGGLDQLTTEVGKVSARAIDIMRGNWGMTTGARSKRSVMA